MFQKPWGRLGLCVSLFCLPGMPGPAAVAADEFAAGLSSEQALALAKQTGRPILAVAGNST